MTPTDVSIVIPTMNEVESIANCIASVKSAGAKQIIVVDGGSQDETVAKARQAGATEIVDSDLGRGIQLNRGASVTTGDVILFLHADNQIDQECLTQICNHPDLVWGAFKQRIDSPRRIYRVIEWGNAWRAKRRGIPFGDQAVFVRRDEFHRQGGYAEISLMEDVEFARRMRRVAKPGLLDGPVIINARRWQAQGAVRQTLRNWTIQVAYRLGVSPERLAKYYRSSPSRQ